MAIVYCSWATGNDTTGDGTAANPYKTITKASAGLTGGDEVRVAKSPDPTALTGTTAWTLNGTTITGSGTLFTSELSAGDFISAPDGNWYEVIAIDSDTSATLYKKYPSETTSGHASQKLGVTDTGPAASSTAQVQVVSSSGSSSAFLSITGGWDLSTETQTGQTWFGQMHTTFANRYGYGLYFYNKDYTSLDKLNFLRYNYGIYYYNGSDNNTILNAICNSNGSYGIYYYSSDNNTIVNVTCNSNGSRGIYYYNGSDNNTIVNAICNSNDSDGIEYSTSSNNTIVNATCNSNDSDGIKYSTSSNNTITNAICNFNGSRGIYYYNGSNNTIVNAICNSNGYYGIQYNDSNNNIIYLLSTSDNTTAAICTDDSTNVCHNVTCNEATKVENTTNSFINSRLYINNLNGYSYIYSSYATANSQDATAGGTGKEWKFNITHANRNSNYPFYIPIARLAVGASGKVTIKVYFKKDGTGIAGALRCRYGQLAWSDGVNDIVVMCPDDTNRNQVTLEFTPTKAGVVEIEAGAWYVSAVDQNIIIDDIEISQA